MSQSNPPPLPVQPIAYASAVPQQGYSEAFWARDGQLITTRTCTLPGTCVKCGQPAVKTLKRKFFWHEPWVYLLILPGILIYAICAIILRKQAEVTFGLCEQHRKSRATKIAIAWLMLLASVGILIFGIALLNRALGGEYETMGALMLPLAFLTMIGAGIFAAIAVPVIKPKKIDDTYAWFKGVGEPFLRQIPQA